MPFKYERIDKDNVVLLVVDHQEGLYQISRDQSAVEMKNNILAHAALGKVFNLPTILTTSQETGPNGPLPSEVIAMHPTAPYIKRTGEVNAWDNADLRAAVEATGKQQVILAGITTDVCTTFLALSLVEAGYTVFANSDTSGTFDTKTASDANDRMRRGGVQGALDVRRRVRADARLEEHARSEGDDAVLRLVLVSVRVPRPRPRCGCGEWNTFWPAYAAVMEQWTSLPPRRRKV